MMRFLNNLEFPRISATQLRKTEQPIQLSEIANSIKLIQSGKTPRPDGYPIEFYKKLA